MPDIRSWLESLNLGVYAEAFEAEDIDLDALGRLSDADLKELGLTMGPRRKVLAAIAEPAAAPDPENTPFSREAERRQITVMFCDLVGSTALSEALDPEELRAVMTAYRGAAGDVVARYDGTVAQYLGDGIMVYFGWPNAHEDDAVRAVRAALDVVAAVMTVAAAQPLGVRIGIATGPVVVGASGEGQGDADLAVGETPNIAARVQGVAQPNTVAVADSTRRLLGNAFDLDDLGSHDAKGVSGGLRVHRVAGESASESRFEATRAAGMTPFVGREEEVAMLTRRWSQAKEGEGQVVLLSGEPGIGKSRITEELNDRLAAEAHTRLRYQCSPYHTNTAFHPIIAQIERAAGFERDDDAEAKLDKLEATLGGKDGDKAVPLIAAMLSLPIDRYPSLELSPQRQKDQTIEALADQVVTLAAEAPVLMILEDAHWIDPTTLDAFEPVIEAVQAASILLVITHRPEFTPPWSGFGHMTMISLNRLSRKQAQSVVAQLTGGKALPDQVLDQIIAKTDGVPLFVEELTKTVLEAGFLTESDEAYALDGPLPPLAIPETLQDSLMARLDRLSKAKDVAQIGACIGREFSFDLLTAISPLGEDDLATALKEAIDSALILARGAPPETKYTFRHAFVRDAAYASLLKDRRRDLHARIADALRTKFPETAAHEPELLALHYDRAARPLDAIEFWLTAAQQAAMRADAWEAIAHAKAGMALVEATTDLPDRDHWELELQVVLATQSMNVEGFASSEVRRAADRVLELGLSLQAVEPLCRCIGAILQAHIWHGRFARGHEAVKAIFELAEARGNLFEIACAIDINAVIHMQSGRFDESLVLVHRLKALMPKIADDQFDKAWGHIPGVFSGMAEAYVLCMRGNVTAARASIRETIDFVERHSSAYFAATSYSWHGADIGYFMHDVAAVEEYARKSIALCNRHPGFEKSLGAVARLHLGWAQAQNGQIDDGLERMMAALDTIRNTGGQGFMVPRVFAEIAEVLGQAGRPEDGLRLLGESPDRTDPDVPPSQFPDIYRIEGDLLLQRDTPDIAAARAKFEHAIAIARPEGSIAWELRATLSLARLLRDQGLIDEARDRLQSVLDRHPEPEGGLDGQEALALLAELGAT